MITTHTTTGSFPRVSYVPSRRQVPRLVHAASRGSAKDMRRHSVEDSKCINSTKKIKTLGTFVKSANLDVTLLSEIRTVLPISSSTTRLLQAVFEV